MFKWILFGISMAIVNKIRDTAEAPQRLREQAAGVARRSLIAISSILIASTILSAGVIIAINNWFSSYENTGSFHFSARVVGGFVLALIGGAPLLYLWPKARRQGAKRKNLYLVTNHETKERRLSQRRY